MSEKKPGCLVRVTLEVLDERGHIISDWPSGGTYGYDREMANLFAIEVSKGLIDAVETVNKMIYGEDWRKELVKRARAVNQARNIL